MLAINAGGPELLNATLRGEAIDFQSNLVAGQGVGYTTTGAFSTYSNGTSTNYDFPGTQLDEVHAYERTSNSDFLWGYSIPLDDGEYVIDLIYSEIYHGFVTAANPDNQRLFDVFIEGQQVEDSYDIIDGAATPGSK